jgi:glc operon protein GlcG
MGPLLLFAPAQQGKHMSLAGRISVDEALAMVTMTLAKAASDCQKVSIAIVDAGGSIIAAARMDDASPWTGELALAKARMSAHCYSPTLQWMHDCQKIPNLMNLPSTIAAGGGLPIVINGIVVGGIGVSGVNDDRDDSFARSALDALVAGGL